MSAICTLDVLWNLKGEMLSQIIEAVFFSYHSHLFASGMFWRKSLVLENPNLYRSHHKCSNWICFPGILEAQCDLSWVNKNSYGKAKLKVLNNAAKLKLCFRIGKENDRAKIFFSTGQQGRLSAPEWCHDEKGHLRGLQLLHRLNQKSRPFENS